MATKPNPFLVGLFVLAGVVIGLGAAVWLGVSKYFQPTGIYLTYFDESVNGLERDAAVKFRGVSVGRVSQIGVAPDDRLVEVTLSLHPDFKVTPEIMARLQSAGITGLKFVGLDMMRHGMKERAIIPDFKTSHPVIPSEPSELKELFESLRELQDRFLQVDFKGISDSIKSSMEGMNKIISNEHWASIFANLDKAMAKLASTTERVENLASDPIIRTTLNETSRMITEGRKLVEETRRQLLALNLPSRVETALGYVEGVTKNAGTFMVEANRDTAQIAEQMSGLVQHVENRSERVLMDLQRAAVDLQQTLENVKQLTESLRERPSSILFPHSPEPRHIEGEKR